MRRSRPARAQLQLPGALGRAGNRAAGERGCGCGAGVTRGAPLPPRRPAALPCRLRLAAGAARPAARCLRRQRAGAEGGGEGGSELPPALRPPALRCPISLRRGALGRRRMPGWPQAGAGVASPSLPVAQLVRGEEGNGTWCSPCRRGRGQSRDAGGRRFSAGGGRAWQARGYAGTQSKADKPQSSRDRRPGGFVRGQSLVQRGSVKLAEE